MLTRLWKRDRSGSGADEAQSQPAVTLADYPGIEPLLDNRDIAGAMALVAATRPDLTATERARIDLQLRPEAYRRAAARPPHDLTWPPEAHEWAAGLPDIQVDDLTVESLVNGVMGSGAVIVRGLLDEAACARLRDVVDRALDAFEHRRGAPDPQWHTPFSGIDGTPLSPTFRKRGYVSFDGQVSVADAPEAAATVLETFTNAGIPALIESYLGEPPVLTLEKWTLRRVPPDTNTSWHQDGAFLGADVHTINLWIALSDCGEKASGLDLVAKRYDEIVATGTPGAYFDWDVAEQVVDESRGSDPIVSPVFRPGDAVFFDQFLLHRTGVKPGMTENRYALESWFFTPSSHPSHYEGLLV
ncbi:MAG: phytanoyl-CoA dioxygenase family protein [Candidatus Nanopelagicales bacterium]